MVVVVVVVVVVVWLGGGGWAGSVENEPNKKTYPELDLVGQMRYRPIRRMGRTLN